MIKQLSNIIFSGIFILVSFSYSLSDVGNQALDSYDRQVQRLEDKKKTSEDELKKVQRDIEKLESARKKSVEKERALQKELDKAKKSMSDLSYQLKKIESEGKNTDRQIVLTHYKYKKIQNETVFWQGILRRELKFLYLWQLTHQEETIEVVPPATEYYLLNFIWQKINVCRMLENKKIITTGQKKGLYQKRKRIEQKYTETSTEYEQVQEIKTEKEKDLVLTREQRERYITEIEKLKKTAQSLQNLISSLERKRKSTERSKDQEISSQKEIREKKGSFPWPVSGKVVTQFGKQKHPELDTFIISNGIKIDSSAGTDVVCIASGEVVYVGEFQSYGQIVIVDHQGGFYTVYGSLREIKVDEGKQVEYGSILGKTGKNPVYFEFRVNGQPDDPLLWLR